MGKKKQRQNRKQQKMIRNQINQTRGQLNRNTRKQQRKNRHRQKDQEYDDEWAAFERQVAILGVRIIDMRRDGNCMYRALADQIAGHPSQFSTFRSDIVDFMRDNTEDFAPFIIGEFDRYCNKMERDAEWGGNLELTAASRRYQVDIVVHQYNQARYEILYQFGTPVQTIHLSYHNNDHYASVRLLTDPGNCPAHPILLGSREQSDSREETRARLAANLTYGTDADRSLTDIILPTGEEQMVMDTSGCSDLARVRELLSWNEGDVASCLDFLALQTIVGDDASPFPTADRKDAEEKQTDDSKDAVVSGEITQETDEKSKRNKNKNKNKCPCGSRRKFKKCCGKLGRRRKIRSNDDDDDDEEDSKANEPSTNLSPQEQAVVNLTKQIDSLSSKKAKKRLRKKISALQEEIVQARRNAKKRDRGDPPPPPVDHGSIMI